MLYETLMSRYMHVYSRIFVPWTHFYYSSVCNVDGLELDYRHELRRFLCYYHFSKERKLYF
uniref:Uncharacterized protein n=1 Tax=Rhizophora mucronata TaxID=61149 RepID=A0A2P2Q846_RHIMU